MEWLEIREIIARGESDTAEFKRGFADGKQAARTIAAFANSEGGVLFLGIEDSGAISGVKEDPERLSERITSFLQTGLSNPVQARVGRHEVAPDTWVFWIEVPRQRGFEPLRANGRVWVRRGRASQEPSPTELQELYNLFGYILTEERAIEAAGEADIDGQAFDTFLRALGLDLDEIPQLEPSLDMQNRGVLVEVAGRLRATLYGILAFGRMPQSFPQTERFWIECVAYAGTDRAADVLLVGEAKGRLDEQIERAMGWFRAIGRNERYQGILREDVFTIPEKALREALVNAVAHRDYAITGSKILLEVFDDRVDITSPGTLPNHLTPASVRAGGHPRSRNELIANFMTVRRLMEQRGRGWPIIRRAMLENNNSEPILQEERDGGFVRVTLPRLKGP